MFFFRCLFENSGIAFWGAAKAVDVKSTVSSRMYIMVSSLFGDESTISDHVRRGKRWGVARRVARLSNQLLKYPRRNYYRNSSTQQTPRPSIKFVGKGIEATQTVLVSV